ncbi:MAG TPA: prolipoprotein diacylglyceryl transferase family protein [Candidatus Acidoferrum sp.]|nr:prolipoprotein diacylglyceryl transferase family protein [Candidatus Acidoferrum sp.]
MIPYLHLGPLSLPTFGLMVAAGLLCAAYILDADFKRRRVQADAFLIIGVAGLAGIAGARLYHVLESPADFFADPWPYIFSRVGFAWFGGFLGGFAALALLARSAKIPLLEFLDACSPAAAAGYAIGRIGCLLSGDGDYGMVTKLPWGMSFPNGIVPTTERVHPTPLYEFFIWLAIAAFLWHMGTKALRGPKAKGEIFCNYLILTGVARFLIEFIRINPKSFFGLSNAQTASVVSILLGAVLLWRIKSQFHALKKEHRIVEHIVSRGDVLQQEYHKPTPECAHPERWHMYDSMSAEVEVLDFLKTLVMTIKPELVVETGTFSGLSTLHIAEGLQANGFGRVITCEYDPKVFASAQKRFASSGLDEWIEARNASSLEMKVDGRIDLLFCDSDAPLREQEVRRFLPQINPHGLIVMHDASSAMKTVREAALKLESEGLLSVLLLPTPRGLVLAQKKEGRS